MSEATTTKKVRLTSLSHGGGCGCKIAPGVLADLLKTSVPFNIPKELLVGTETADDAAVYQINEHQALIATTDFFMPIVDNPRHFGQIAATNAISDIYAMGGQPLMALALVGMPINVLPASDIAEILDGGREICARAGIPIAGGHSIDSVEPIYGLAVIGLIDPKNLKKNSTAKAGDVLVLGKPLGVGIYSAALKKDQLSTSGYEQMIANTTKLNTPGQKLSALSGVHAMTDVTGFGLLGHALEICKGSNTLGKIEYSSLKILPGVQGLANQGCVTGASGRNWNSYGQHVKLSDSLDPVSRAILTDPQTSGGLLVACAPEAVNDVLNVFKSDGFADAVVIGSLGSLDSSDTDGIYLQVA
ncbi:MAG: selenide, water dikinase SelD [Polynucleobacter sp.]|nr:MAG: selenide, water dikinase SelD [Polynucleobacter sp.]